MYYVVAASSVEYRLHTYPRNNSIQVRLINPTNLRDHERGRQEVGLRISHRWKYRDMYYQEY